MCDIDLAALLPQLAAVRVDAVEPGTGVVRITARSREGVAVACPACGWSSAWVHSRYVRHVADEAVGGRPVLIDLSVRRLYCENPACPKTTFVEQVTGLTARYQRRTPALHRPAGCGRGGPGGENRRPAAAVPAPGGQLQHAATPADGAAAARAVGAHSAGGR
ncbi:transposase family protein [Frankia sp. Cas4]|uniref:transposase family protein n=1 Tax=Frankia sp. Cas4 TaxID=3073927 RepID=UPI003A0FC52D